MKIFAVVDCGVKGGERCSVIERAHYLLHNSNCLGDDSHFERQMRMHLNCDHYNHSKSNPSPVQIQLFLWKCCIPPLSEVLYHTMIIA